jgi:hypothetical protein
MKANVLIRDIHLSIRSTDTVFQRTGPCGLQGFVIRNVEVLLQFELLRLIDAESGRKSPLPIPHQTVSHTANAVYGEHTNAPRLATPARPLRNAICYLHRPNHNVTN